MAAVVTPPPIIQKADTRSLREVMSAYGPVLTRSAEEEALQRSVAQAAQANHEALVSVLRQGREVVSFERRARETLGELMKDMGTRHGERK